MCFLVYLKYSFRNMQYLVVHFSVKLFNVCVLNLCVPEITMGVSQNVYYHAPSTQIGVWEAQSASPNQSM